MKNLVIYLALFCLNTFAVDQSLEEKISDKLCDCFESIDQSLGGVDALTKFQENYFMQTLKVFESEINTISDTIKDGTDYERGRKLGLLISARTQVIMIERCDQFFYFMNKFRNEIFKTVNKEKELLNIKAKTQEISEKQQASGYYLRAVSYFALREFRLTKKDLDKAIELDGNYPPAYLLRGFMYEQTKKYDRAITDYEKSNKLMTRSDIDIYIAMAKRKARRR